MSEQMDPAAMWAHIVAIEPRLMALFEEANSFPKDSDPFCANKVWYGILKPELVNLVGLYAQKDELKTSYAYDVAYQKIYYALPDCRNCNELAA